MTACAHRRVREVGPVHLVKGPPPSLADPTRKPTGYHVSQSGICLDCGFPVLRVSAHATLGAWDCVAEGATPRPRTRGADEQYGTGRDAAA